MLDRTNRPVIGHAPKVLRSLRSMKTLARIAAAALFAAPLFLTGCLEGAAGSADNSAKQVELPTVAAVTLTRQAEDAVLVGAVKAANWSGYTRTGFVDFLKTSGESIKWTVSVTEAGKYTLKFRYANGGSFSRPLAIQVNGVTVNASLAFAPSGAWTTWTTVSLSANLVVGNNTVVASSIGSSGANIDWLQASGPVLVSDPTLRKANLTWFTSYPDPGSEECIKYNGCQWAGYFAGVDGKMSESWVAANNIAAVHERDFAKYRLKTLRLTQGTKTIDVKVYDMCSDSDCNGCCTANAAATGFLIDVESYTAERFGTRSGTVDWKCLDCQ
jgi:hypothetical protein